MKIHHVVCILLLILLLFGSQNADAKRDTKTWNTMGDTEVVDFKHNDRYHVGAGGYACGELTNQNCHHCEESVFDSVPIFCNEDHWAQRYLSSTLHYYFMHTRYCVHGRDDNLEKCHMKEFRSCCQCVAPYCSLLLRGDFHDFKIYMLSNFHLLSSLFVTGILLVLIYYQSFKHNKEQHIKVGKFAVHWILIPWILVSVVFFYHWVTIEHHGLNPFLWHMFGAWQFMRINWYYLLQVCINPFLSCLVSFNFLKSSSGIYFLSFQKFVAVYSFLFFFLTAHWEFFPYIEDQYVLYETVEMYTLFGSLTSFDIAYHCFYLPNILFFKGVKYQTWKAYHAYEAFRFVTISLFTLEHVLSRKKEFTTDFPLFPIFGDFLVILFVAYICGERVYEIAKKGHEFAVLDNEAEEFKNKSIKKEI